jgi:predicted nucleic acid-binding Zn ribbon protein
MRKCPNCNERISPDQYFCSGACREEWNDAQRANEDAKTPYEKIKDENFGCLVMSIVATIFFSLPVVAGFISRSTPVLDNNHVNPHEEGGLYFFGGMFALFAGITFICIRKMIRDAKEERLNQAKISAEAAKNRRPILGTDFTAEEKKNLRLPPSW